VGGVVVLVFDNSGRWRCQQSRDRQSILHTTVETC